MRHRVAVIGTSEVARCVALLLLVRDDCHVLLTGEDGEALQGAAVALAVEPRVDGPVDATALTAVAVAVVCDADEAPVQELCHRAPAALLVVATTQPERDARAMQDHLRWPRQRVLGIDTRSAASPSTLRAAAAVRLVDHVLADRGRRVEATVQTIAEGGADSWASVLVTLGGTGVQSIHA